jgi:hypothetical protein
MDLANRDTMKDITVWIGAKRNNSVDYFEWTNGQEFNYSNWASDEPKNSTDPESEVSMYNDGMWTADDKNLFKALFICERNLSDE